MTEAKTGATVRIHYTGSLEDGSVFDSSQGRDPLEFTLGSGQVIPGFDVAVAGMTTGEKKRVTIPADQAYGQPDPRAIQAIPRENIPAEIPLEVGLQLQAQSPQGYPIPVTVVEISENEVTLDANHHLAGKDLTFDLELVSVG